MYFGCICIGVKGMEQGVRLSSGPLQFLFQRMLAMDRVAVANFRALPKNAGLQAVAIADYVFNDKAEWIQQYLQLAKIYCGYGLEIYCGY